MIGVVAGFVAILGMASWLQWIVRWAVLAPTSAWVTWALCCLPVPKLMEPCQAVIK